jgi:hypothetical protein
MAGIQADSSGHGTRNPAGLTHLEFWKFFHRQDAKNAKETHNGEVVRLTVHISCRHYSF